MTGAKQAVRNLIDGWVARYGSTLAGLFNRMGNIADEKQVMSVVKGFGERKEGEVYPLTSILFDLGMRESAQLSKINLTEQQFAGLKSNANTFNVMISGKKISDSEHRDATANIARLLADIKQLNDKQISRFMDAFGESHPNLLALYKKVSTIDYPHRRHRDNDAPADDKAVVTFSFTDATTGNPLEGVTIALDGVMLEDISDDSGEVYLDDVVPGTHVCAASAPGYQSREWNTPELMAGEEYTFEELLSPEA